MLYQFHQSKAHQSMQKKRQVVSPQNAFDFDDENDVTTRICLEPHRHTNEPPQLVSHHKDEVKSKVEKKQEEEKPVEKEPPPPPPPSLTIFMFFLSVCIQFKNRFKNIIRMIFNTQNRLAISLLTKAYTA